MTTHAQFLAVLLAALVGLAGCLAPPSADPSEPAADAPPAPEAPAAATVAVSLTGMAFVDQEVALVVGDSIVWTHEDGPLAPHTVTTDDGASDPFDSHPACVGVPVSGVCMTGGDTFTWLFERAGTVGIHCKVHGDSMSMTVLVAAGGSAL